MLHDFLRQLSELCETHGYHLAGPSTIIVVDDVEKGETVASDLRWHGKGRYYTVIAGTPERRMG